MKKSGLVLLTLMCLICIPSISIQAKQVKVGAFRYTYKIIDKDTCNLTTVEVVNKKKAKVLRIPNTLGGKKVVRMSAPGLYDSNILGLYETDENTEIYPKELIKQSRYVKEIILPDTLKSFETSCFTNLPELTKITIPALVTKGVETLKDNKWTSFKVSKNNKKYQVKNGFLLSKSGKTLYCYVEKVKDAIIPNGVKTIKKMALWGMDTYSIYFPKTVDSIGVWALQNGRAIGIKVSKKNKHYKMSGDCLYSKKSGRLVAAIHRKNTLTIPEGVTKLEYGISTLGGEFNSIKIAKSVQLLDFEWEFFILKGESCQEEQAYGRLHFISTTPPNITYMHSDIIYVPMKALTKYISVLRRKGFKDVEIIGE